MSIKNIQELKQFGIFQDHTNANAKDFGKYNLFYGWNGSGKSTLSNVFRCIENKTSEKFPFSKFLINIESNPPIKQSNITEHNLNIYTFNNDFIEEHISWNTNIKSILLVDKAKIKEREELEKLKKKENSNSEIYEEEVKEIENLRSAISKFCTESARHLKTSLQSIDTTDKYYLNYDKPKFETFIKKNLQIIKTNTPLLEEDKILELTNTAKPNQKNLIPFTLQTIHQELFIKSKEKLDNLLKTSVVSKTIQRLVDHIEIKCWVETGLDLHKHHKTNQCEFCGNVISEERTKELEAHFNDDYKDFQNKLVEAESWLANQIINLPNLPVSSDFYEELKKKYDEACKSLEEAKTGLNKEISTWQNILKKKKENPLETSFITKTIDESLINAFNSAIKTIEEIIGKHNHKSENFKEETNKARKQLEQHFVTTEVKNFDYFKKNAEIDTRENKNNDLKKSIDDCKSKIETLEKSLSNESLGADQFNKSLRKFLGRDELTLRFNPEKKGYEIIRNNSDLVEGNLSEGEKTAIAFVYFITKIKENDNKMENTIVVVDDPVSSFDSNHLCHAYSFLRENCDNAKQLFVLTHNFTYFKLIRDWFEGMNRNKISKNKDINAFFYTIETSTTVPRCSTYADANPCLIKYHSEYHYIFSKLHTFKDRSSLSLDDAFLTANLARKLLESFFSFKFPKHRSNFYQLMDCGIKGCKITDKTTKEKIYRFINKYSHSAGIEINEDSSENLIGESHNVITDIFEWIHEVDEIHYNEMQEVIK